MMSSPLLSKMREDYKLGNLDESSILESPFKQFEKWFEDEILWKSVQEPNAMTLCTCSKEGRPSSRVVLLKYFDENGFVFFTNYNSRKSKEMIENPFAAISFLWTQRQVRIEGTVEKLEVEESVKYFKTRPRESQIGAWVSEFQSSEITKQKLIETQYLLEKQYHGKEVPKPDFWGGWRIVPTSFEFWQGKGGRIHDRIKFKLNPLVIPLFKDLKISQGDNTNTEEEEKGSVEDHHPGITDNTNNVHVDHNRWIIKRLSP